MKKRILRVVVVLAVLGAGGFFVWRSGVLDKHAREPSDSLTLYGNVDIRQVDLGFRVAGRIAAMQFEEGDVVKAGDLMARLDDRSYNDEVNAAEAQLSQQAATLAKLVRGPRPAEIEQARASVAERKANMERAQQTFDRTQALQASGAVAQASLDDARTALEAARAAMDAASQALRLLEQGSRVEDIEAARASVEMSKARLGAAQTSLADTHLLAPSDGVILSRVREPGAIVSPADVVYTLSLTKPVWVRAYVDEAHLGNVVPGMEVEVKSDGNAPPRRGRIGFVSPVAEFTPKSVETPNLRTDLVYRLRITLDDADSGLRQGMPVTVRLPLTAAAHVAQAARER
jgi:HlyD family secretion protein